jgi:methionine-rich copper-binding protein CopC
MILRASILLAASASMMFASQAALAHAQLESATPSVGGAVSGSPSTIQLRFNEGVEARYSRVSVSGPGGEVPVSKPSNAGEKTSLTVKVGRRLQPGTYHVSWSVVSVDSHKTQGSFSFSVRP